MSGKKEAQFRQLMEDFAQIRGQQLLELEKTLPPLPEAERRQLLAAAQAQKQAREKIPAWPSSPAWRRYAAAAALALLAGSTALLGEAGAVGNVIRQLKMEETQRATLFTVETEQPDPWGLHDRYLPSWVPKNYEIKQEELLFDSHFMTYEDRDGHFIRFDRYLDVGTLGVDSENAESVEKIKINDYDGILVRKNNRWDLNWHDDSAKSFFSIYADDLSRGQILKFAESVKFSEFLK